MGYYVPERVIRLLCGSEALDKGRAYYDAGRVRLTYIENNNRLEYSIYRAEIHGLESYEAALTIDADGDVNAECTCPAYYHGGAFCRHIAAGLVGILRLEEGDTAAAVDEDQPSQLPDPTPAEAGVLTPRNAPVSSPGVAERSGDRQLVSGMLEVFADGSSNSRPRPSVTGSYSDLRTPLQVEFICKPVTISHRTQMLGIELKVGPKRPYIVQKIRTFLDRVQRREPFEFSRHFSYDPALHSFDKEDNAVLLKLIEISANEQLYRAGVNPYAVQSGGMGGDRVLAVPPVFWEALLPVLLAAPSAYLQQGDLIMEKLQLSAEAPRSTSRLTRRPGKATGLIFRVWRRLWCWRITAWYYPAAGC